MDIEKVKFILKLNRLAKEEGSNYAKLLFQENILSLHVMAALQTIESFLNKQNIEVNLKEDRKIEFTNFIEIEFDIKELEEKTLGQLCGFFYPYLKKENGLESKLKEFVKLRNHITHKMLTKYNSFEELEKDSCQIVKIGSDVIGKINTFIDKFDLDNKIS